MKASERISLLEFLRAKGRLEGDESKNISLDRFGSYHLLDPISEDIQLVRHVARFFAQKQGAVRLQWCTKDKDDFVKEATYRRLYPFPFLLKTYDLIIEDERMGLVEELPLGEPILQFCAKQKKENVYLMLEKLALAFDQLQQEGVPIQWIPDTSILVHSGEIVLTELGLWNKASIPATMRWLLSEATRRSIPEYLVTWGQIAIRALEMEGEGTGGNPLVFSLLKGTSEGSFSCRALLQGLQTQEKKPIFVPKEPLHVEGERESVLQMALGTVLLSWARVRSPNGHFFLLQTPITQVHLEAIGIEHQHHFQGSERPAERVSLLHCMKICNKLSDWLGLEERYRISKRGISIVEDSIGVRIPTEEEWMRAAKAGDPYVFSGSINPKLCAWYEDNSNNETAPVQKLQPNRLGLYDMSGNVWEWVHDPETNEGHAMGGSFQESYSGIELGARLTLNPKSVRPDLGFRPLLPISWTT